ncbi:UNVERIFIED_CONTAM: hypothetical protein FKN15_037215 [Acipenser sinensis]
MAACSRIGGGGHSMDKSITLPPDEIFRNLENAKRFAIDIGGSLTKLAYYSTVQHKVAKVRSFDHTGKASEFCMNIKPYRFYIVSKTRATRNASEMNSMAKWFFQETEDEPLYEISVQEEITARLHFIKFENAYIETCLDFVKDHLVNTETKVIKATGGGAHKFKDLLEKKLKLKVDKEDEMSCLIKGCNFVLKNIPHEAFVYVKHAEPEFRFQTTHPDIFPYLLINIGSGVSIVKVESEDKFERIGGSSIGGGTFWGLGALLTKTKAKSLLHMISNDIGQLACLYAKLHNLSRVYFGGFFIRGHPVTMHTITYSINFFTKGEVQALFLRHEGYLGAIGAFLKGAEEDNPNQYSWGENYAGSSGLMSVSPDMFPMQRTRSGTVVKRAVASQPDLQDARERAEKFRLKYRHKLQTLRHQPCAYGSLTIKQRENDLALRYFQKVVRSVEMLNWEERQFALVKGLLAGNMFDWGAKAVSDVLETDPAFGFDEAKRQLQERPWLVDSYSKWIERLKGPPHKCALFFVDNSGIDIILGVFPLVRELLCRGTEVVLASNSGPALNDVTYNELQILTERIAAMDSVIHSGITKERLILVQSGSSSPCLDLSRLDKGLATLVRERHTDLVVIEGMGRAIHTNYYAVLRCESLKLAVIKNSWLAERLGGKIYSVVFKYEQPSK